MSTTILSKHGARSAVLFICCDELIDIVFDNKVMITRRFLWPFFGTAQVSSTR